MWAGVKLSLIADQGTASQVSTLLKKYYFMFRRVCLKESQITIF